MLHRRRGMRSLVRRSELWLAGVALAGVVAPLLARPRPAENSQGQNSQAQVAFNRDIAPIIFRSCAACHRPGEAAPFSLLTYSDVRRHARQIADVAKSRSMPPWLPEPQPLKFADEQRLSSAEIDRIAKWVEQGAIAGDPKDLPPAPKFVEGWRLGKPDLILTATKPFTLPPSGTDTYWNFIFPVPIERTRWVKAIEIRPGDKRYVHHANILVDRAEESRRRETEVGAGFGGMEIRIESQVFDPDSHLLFWKPGTMPAPEPEGMALRLDKGTDLILNTHLQPSGKPEVIQPSIGLYFTDQAATVSMRYTYDNSDENPMNPNHPPARVVGGNRSTDEMCHLWLQVLPVNFNPANGDPRMELQEALARHNIGKNPKDFEAHYNLAAMLQSKGNLEAAIREYEAAVLLRPDDAVANNGWGAALLAAGQPKSATPILSAAIHARPDYAEAHYNLGIALTQMGDMERAIEQFETVLKLQPNDANAEANLGASLAELGRYGEAASHLERALKIDPNQADAKDNLEAVRKAMGAH